MNDHNHLMCDKRINDEIQCTEGFKKYRHNTKIYY